MLEAVKEACNIQSSDSTVQYCMFDMVFMFLAVVFIVLAVVFGDEEVLEDWGKLEAELTSYFVPARLIMVNHDWKVYFYKRKNQT